MNSKKSNDEQSAGAPDGDPSEANSVDEQSAAHAEAEVGVLTTSLDKQSLALRELLVSAIERTRAGEELTAPEVDAIRTEIEELQASVEEFLAGRCDDTEPWEGTGHPPPPGAPRRTPGGTVRGVIDGPSVGSH